jgi:hypothetical protein
MGYPARARVRRLAERVYADLFMPSRLGAYAAFLRTALEAGYDVVGVGSFWRSGGASQGEATRVLVLRHDVDTDPRTAAAMWRVDRRLGIDSSYFFRLATLDADLAARVTGTGGEASYHYEELATIIKRRRLRTREAAVAALPEARDMFARHVGRLRSATGLPIRVVAAHGDFVNRRLGIANQEILADLRFREEVGIDLETYDAGYLARLSSRFSDTLHPRYWDPSDPAAAIRAGDPVVSVLVHPRHWRTDPAGNLRDDARRVADEIRFRLPG